MRTNPRHLGAIAAIGTIAVAVASLTGCTAGGEEKETSADYKLTTVTPEPTSEIDTITWNVFQGEPFTIDPFRSSDYAPNMINSNMCETLFRQTPESEIEPNLATAAENPDPLTWVYQIRDDVTFWDGSPMTVDDVVFSMQHNLNDPTSFYNYKYANVASVEATGDHEVTVSLSSPDYLFTDELASYAGVVVQKEFYQEHSADVGSPSVGVMCTGPFQFENWSQGTSITISRYDDHWNADLLPQVKEIEFTFLTDNSAITSALLSGEIDGTFQPPVAAVPQLRASTEGTLYFGPSPLVVTTFYANPDGPMRELGMRKALQLATDWSGIAEQVFGGIGGPTPLQTPESVYGFASDALTELAETVATPGEPDIEAANVALEGVPADVRSEEITMVVPEQSETQQLGLAIKSAADQLGLNFTLNVVPAGQYTNYLFDPATRGDTDILYTTFWPNIPDPLDWMQTTAVSGGTFNPFGYTGIDADFATAVATEDVAARAELVTKMEKQLYEDLAPMAPGISQDNTTWLNNRITGAPSAFAYTYYPWAAHLGGTE